MLPKLARRSRRVIRLQDVTVPVLLLVVVVIVGSNLHLGDSPLSVNESSGLQKVRGSFSTMGSISIPTAKGKIALMHVGKTGGETLRRRVFALSCRYMRDETERNNCLADVGEESLLSLRTRGICHFNKQWPSNRYTQRAGNYLFTTRDPLARFESWYRFTTPINCNLTRDTKIDGCLTRQRIGIRGPTSFSARFWKCFPSIVILSESLTPGYVAPMKIWNRTDCLNLLQEAFEAVDGGGELFHLTANYRHYSRLANFEGQPNKTVWAARLEHQWDDIEAIDLAFGGDGNFSRHRGYRYTHGTERLRDTRGLTGNVNPETMLRVCCALWPDMMAYKAILESAANLNDKDRLETYRITWQRCGKNIDSWDALKQRCKQTPLTVNFFE